MSNKQYKALIEMRDKIVEYLETEKGICEDALKAYEPGAISEINDEIKVMRERERIKLIHSVRELKRYIEVIKRMYPNG